MGVTCSRKARNNDFSLEQENEQKQNGIDLSWEAQVQRYMPGTFPINPIVSKESATLCKKSWRYIKENKYKMPNGDEIEGTTYFYDQFFNRLFDGSRRYNLHFPDIKMRGRVLFKVMHAVSSFNKDELVEAEIIFKNLGRYHRDKDIRPWQYGMYAQKVVESVAFCLGEKADANVMAAWVNAFAFILKYMLPLAIKPESIISSEAVFNASDLFDNAREVNKVEELSDRRSLEKGITGVQSSFWGSKVSASNASALSASSRSSSVNDFGGSPSSKFLDPEIKEEELNSSPHSSRNRSREDRKAIAAKVLLPSNRGKASVAKAVSKQGTFNRDEQRPYC